ncbi:MAG: hypothetical protein K0U48_03525, partial [Actinomycetia bacterium]|nr:hypothetical protein [Actinomycetes bacterium]
EGSQEAPSKAHRKEGSQASCQEGNAPPLDRTAITKARTIWCGPSYVLGSGGYIGAISPITTAVQSSSSSKAALRSAARSSA